MKVNRELSDIMRDLTYLNIDSKEKRKLLKRCYGCFPRLLGFPKELKNSINETKEKNLQGKEAYSFIENYLEDYEKEIVKKDYESLGSEERGFMDINY